MDYLEIVGPAFLGHIPMLLAWLVGIVIAGRMLRRGGGKAEKLLLTGCSLMFAGQIISPFLMALATLMVHEQGISRASTVGLVVSLPTGIVNVAGIVSLIFAFWTRWKSSAVSQ